MSIIMVLAAMTLAGVTYAQNKARESRATAEIKAMEVALESYKADNGDYPRSKPVGGVLGTGNDSNLLNAQPSGPATPDLYKNASLALYAALSGDIDLNGFGGDPDPTTSVKNKIYFEFKSNMLLPKQLNGGTVTALVDPWGNTYGYSTINSVDNTKGYNPTFDLWSTGNPDALQGADAATAQQKWIKNW